METAPLARQTRLIVSLMVFSLALPNVAVAQMSTGSTEPVLLDPMVRLLSVFGGDRDLRSVGRPLMAAAYLLPSGIGSARRSSLSRKTEFMATRCLR
jgi:hypothetical protein